MRTSLIGHIVLFVCGVAIGWGANYYWQPKNPSSDKDPQQLRLYSYKLINPLLACENSPARQASEFEPLKTKIKAAGQIRSREFALELILAGADRIGTSSSVEIMTKT